jgi:folate-binding protein YgfZ
MSIAATLSERAAEQAEVAGTALPLHFGDPAGEYEAARRSVALCFRHRRALVHVSGADHRKLLNGLLTSNVESLQAGDGRRALFLDTKGHVRGVLDLWADDADLVIGCDAAFIDASLADLTKYVLAADARFEDLRASHCVLAVVGPAADALLAAAGAETLPHSPYAHARGSLAGVAVRMARTPDLGPPGVELHVPAESAEGVWTALESAAGVESPKYLGWSAVEAIRVESGIPRFGAEVTGEEFPQEARLDDAVDYEKGCYLGQETVARIHYRGQVNRLLAGFASDAPLPAGAELISSDRGIGMVTSVAESPRRGHIGLAYIRREDADGGVVARAHHDGEDIAEVRVVALPMDE